MGVPTTTSGDDKEVFDVVYKEDIDTGHDGDHDFDYSADSEDHDQIFELSYSDYSFDINENKKTWRNLHIYGISTLFTT